jgi:hypothetical protein
LVHNLPNPAQSWPPCVLQVMGRDLATRLGIIFYITWGWWCLLKFSPTNSVKESKLLEICRQQFHSGMALITYIPYLQSDQ